MRYDDMVTPPSQLSRWLHLLISDRRMRASWMILLGSMALETLILRQAHNGDGSHLFDFGEISLGSTVAGYIGWSTYWGIPAYRSVLKSVAHIWWISGCPVGCISIAVLFVLSVLTLLLYPPLGGGVLHFSRHWVYLARGGVDADPNAGLTPTSAIAMSSEVRSRLDTLADLHRAGVITRAEHDQRRGEILKDI